MNKLIKLMGIMFVVALSMTTMSCSNDEDNSDSQKWEPGTIALNDTEKLMAANNNDFSIELFKKTFAANQNKSCVVSPLSMTYVLSMASTGARGTTQTELQDVLGFSGSNNDAINTFNQKMIQGSSTIDKSTELNIANIAIFDNQSITLQDNYVTTLKNYYDAAAKGMNFSQSNEVVDYVNQWASDHTKGMIPHMIDEISADLRMILMNAVYFKGKWYSKFDKKRTEKNYAFTKEDGTQTKVQMMSQTGNFAYTETDDCQLAVLPYGNGSYRMAVMLPKTGKTVKDVLDGLTGKSFSQLLDQSTTHEVSLYLPKFTTEYTQDYVGIISQMGANTLFTSNADFGDITTDADLFVNILFQKAKIIVDEEGTEAAAVTFVGFTNAAAPSQPVSFIADHPFVYAIYESSTKMVYFMGTYMGE